MAETTDIYAYLQDFAEAVRKRLSQTTKGEPEDQLRSPFDSFMTKAAEVLGKKVVCVGETKLQHKLGKPDFGISANNLLAGYAELKAPGIGADTKRFVGHNREQWNRFQLIPNLIYTDGNEWALYRNGERIDKIARLSGDVSADGKKAVTQDDALAVERIIRDFLLWEPLIPTDRQGRIDLRAFADQLAPICRMLRNDVTESLLESSSPLVQLAREWRQLLFPDASDDQFADAYAQTVTFALLLGRSEGADPLTFENAESALAAQHSLLSRALQILTDKRVRTEMPASLDLLTRIIDVVPMKAMSGPEDPWLYFYEHFLAVYDPKLRKDAGAYYTPVEVVHAQVRLIDDLLVNRLGKPLGFAESGVVTIDPAAGTGTYLLGVIEHALTKVERDQGMGAVPGQATALASNLYGFEIMVGPYAVTELRVSRALRDKGATLPEDGSQIYLTDTLESPNAKLMELAMYLKPIAEQHAKAVRVKKVVPVIVCLGNPPYDRHDAVDPKSEQHLSRAGGWVRFGDPAPPAAESQKDKRRDKSARKPAKTPRQILDLREQQSILYRDFVRPVSDAGLGVHLKNLYNLYVYFWRWALWKVFEHKTAAGPGVVSFISASSYLDGDAFCGMREHMRRVCDEIWILDLGGEGRGTRKTENVFAIQTPVAIAVAVRAGKVKKSRPATVHYARIEGTREAKLAGLDSMTGFATVEWQKCPEEWQAPFRPAGKGGYFDWPLLTDLMPWQHSGVQLKRTWPIAPDKETLEQRWRELLHSKDRSVAFHGTGDREIDGTYTVPLVTGFDSTPIARLPKNAAMPPAVRYGYRSFDRQMIIADGRLMSRARPDLWSAHGDSQVYIITLLNHPLGSGPALTCCGAIPDLDHFRGSFGAKQVIPLFRDSRCTTANVSTGLLDLMSEVYGRQVTPEQIFSYLYGIYANASFTKRFAMELESCELRVPITRDAGLFARVCDSGAHLLWLHTYGERFVPRGHKRGHVPHGKAKCQVAVPGTPTGYPESFEYNDAIQTLRVGDGAFRPVQREVFEFEVSGLKVVQSWLRYRMKKGGGKKSSPLDDIRPERWTSQFTTELLELLWVLEATLECYPMQAKLLDAIVSGPCFRADELPPVPDEMRKPPSARSTNHDLFESEADT
jgi:hypothetical protein